MGRMIRYPIKKGNNVLSIFMYASLLMKLTAFLRKVYVSNFLMLIPILLYNDQVIWIINRFPIHWNIHKHENVEIDIGYKMISIASKVRV